MYQFILLGTSNRYIMLGISDVYEYVMYCREHATIMLMVTGIVSVLMDMNSLTALDAKVHHVSLVLDHSYFWLVSFSYF